MNLQIITPQNMAEGRSSARKRDRCTDDPRTYDDMVTHFIMTLTHRRPEKLKEIQALMKPENSTLDMFSFIWGLKEAHFKLNPPVFTSKKSDENSFIYWRLGNTHLTRKDKDLALKYFNLSIQVAPHPPIIVDDKVVSSEVVARKQQGEHQEKLEGDPGCHSPEGWGEYVSLAYAYEARACLLLDMNQYKKCMRDIDLVLELGCPPIIAEKLNQMRKICEENIESPREEASSSASQSRKSESTSSSPGGKAAVDSPVSFKYRCPDPPVLVDPNPAIPAFSTSVRLAYNKDVGRFLVATRDISHGE